MTAPRDGIPETLNRWTNEYAVRHTGGMDVLSDIMTPGRGQAAILSRFDYRGPWGIRLDACARAGLHYVERGVCWIRTEGMEPVRLMQGDVALVPLGASHVLADAPRRRAQPLADVMEAQARIAEDEPVNARVICAAREIHGDLTAAHPLLEALPPLIHIPQDIIRRCPNLSPCLTLLLSELGREAPGRSAAVRLVLEAILVYVIRNWLETQPTDRGWVGALRDPGLARALSVMHASPEEGWTVDALAHEAKMSRATFARRFRATVGTGPSAYLARLRIDKGAGLLARTDASLAEVASEVGYTSEFAFSRAFKRTVGVPPSAYRDARRAEAAVASA